MLPGYISGFYSFDDVHIDLSRLARFAGARLIHAEARGLDTRVGREVGRLSEGKYRRSVWGAQEA